MRPVASETRKSRPRVAPSAVNGRRGADHLETAESQQLGAHPPKEGWLEFETDEEEHHDDTELGEVHDVFGALADESQSVGTYEDAGHQVAENGAEPEAFRDRDRDDGGDEVDEGLKEEGVHLAECGQGTGRRQQRAFQSRRGR